MPGQKKKALLISFEGIDGCGKTTQLGLLHDRLIGNNIDTLALREPGGTDLSEAVRSILLDHRYPIHPTAEMLLFSAARSQLIQERILPALDAGTVVLLDRFFDSTTAYQGYGRQQMAIDYIEQVNRIATGGLVPDITFYFEVDVATAYARRSKESDRMEQSGTDFYARVIEGYHHLAQQNPMRFVTIDAMLPMVTIHEILWQHIQLKLNQA